MTLRVVVADDHPIFRAGLRSLLEADPEMEIVADVEDGLAALEACRSHTPDIVLIDISMPGMNGVEATRQMTATEPGVRVLVLSMHLDTRFVHAAFRSGARGYLLKECAAEELITAIHAVVAGQIYTSAALGDALLAGFGASGGSDGLALSLLTSREREVLQLLSEGHPVRDIATRLHVSVKTVGTHREHLMQKLDTHSLAGLTKFAIREGLTSDQA